MGTAFSDFDQYARRALPGQLEDHSDNDVITRVIADTAGVGFGLAVSDIDGVQCEIPGAGDAPNAITLRNFTSQNDATDQPLCEQGRESSLIRKGRVWVACAGASAKGQVYVTPDTGAISASSGGGNLTFENAKFVTATGSDGMVLVQLNGN